MDISQGTMEQENPQWLTTEFLQQCLQNEKRYNKITITSFKASLAAPAGNNYGSLVLRVNIRYKEESITDKLNTISIIIKGPVTVGALSEVISSDMQDCEPIFYNKYIPEAYELYNYSFAPKSIFSPLSSVVVLEDLKEHGYLMADRTKQLDFDHCKLYMIAAASMHAGSVGVHKHNPELINTIGKQKMFANDLTNSAIFRKTTKLQMESLAKHIPNQRHSKLVGDVADSVWDMLVETHKPSELINCLNQGDPWTTNMMFRYDNSGKVSDIKIIDFQVPMYTSPLHDVVFFLWSSSQHSVRRHKLAELYRIYIEHFNKVLKQLEYTETLTYESFVEEAQRMTPLILWVLSFMAFSLNPTANDMNSVLEKVNQYDSTSENPYEQFYTNSFCQNQLQEYLEDIELVGVFSYLEKIEQPVCSEHCNINR